MELSKKKNDRIYNKIPYPPRTPLSSEKIWDKPEKSKIKINPKPKDNNNASNKRRQTKKARHKKNNKSLKKISA